MIGLFGEVHSPTVKGGNYLFTFQNFNNYSHSIAAVGGFWDASLSLAVGQPKAEDWYEQGLGRQIWIKNQFGGTVWRGFVNDISISAGSQTLTRGPLLEIANRAGAIYTPREYPPDGPPEDGTTTITELVDDTPSQLNFGIFEKWATAGSTSLLNAEKVRNVFLAENRLPKTTGDFSLSGTGQPISLTLNLLGNIHWATIYPYNNTTPGVITAIEKIKNVLNANSTINPGVWSTDYSYMADNAFPVDALEDKNRFAWDVISEIIALGNDVDDLRRIIGVYEDNKWYYNVMPTTVEYDYRLSSQRQQIMDYKTGAMIYPWDVRPGKWIRTSDWLIGRLVNSSDLFNDPRNKFIESVSFSAPYTVGINGSPFDTLAQMLSKITYTGGMY